MNMFVKLSFETSVSFAACYDLANCPGLDRGRACTQRGASLTTADLDFVFFNEAIYVRRHMYLLRYMCTYAYLCMLIYARRPMSILYVYVCIYKTKKSRPLGGLMSFVFVFTFFIDGFGFGLAPVLLAFFIGVLPSDVFLFNLHIWQCRR